MLDSFVTGERSNLATLLQEGGVTLIEADITEPVDIDGAARCRPQPGQPGVAGRLPRQPPAHPSYGSAGTERLVELALAHDARFLMASTSEVYGEPLVHPQPESYWGT